MALKNKNLEKIPVIINCDTGIDDAVALMMAVKSDKFDIRLITTDVGNVGPKQSAINCNDILELIGGPEVPICAGEGKCLTREREHVAVHGKTGLGEYKFPKNSRKILDEDVVEVLNRTINESNEKLTILCVSPTTNLAKLFQKYPESAKKIEKIVIMAGSIEPTPKGVPPYPEFNISVDPEAAEIVFGAGVPMEIVPMEMGHTAYLDWQEVFKTKNLNFVGSVFEVMFRAYKDRHVKNGIAMHDGTAVAYMTNPELFKVSPVHTEIEYFDSVDTGIITMDFKKKPNAITCTEINIKKFKKLYFDLLKKCK